MSKLVLQEGPAADTPDTGRIALYAKTDGALYSKNDSGTELPVLGQKDPESNTITLQNPNNSEDMSFFFTDVAITVYQMNSVVVGSASPSVTWTMRHDTDRSAAGNEVITAGTVCANETTGVEDTSFNDATIPADSWVWLETTAKSGTVDTLTVTMFYTED
jgi:hypothetical protein